MDYTKIDCILLPWLAAKGYQLQSRDRDEAVRAFLIWSDDHREKAQIGITSADQDRVEIGVFDGHRKRERFTCSLESLADSLNRAERLAKQWVVSQPPPSK